MNTFRIIRNLITVLIGVAGVAVGFWAGGDMKLVLLGLALAGWGGFSMYRESRDSRASGEVGQLAEERERIRRELENKG